MIRALDLDTKNAVTVMLVQALLGAISPNFRMISLSFAKPEWKLLFVLENESVIDLEEIEDAAAEFDGLLLGLNERDVQFSTEIIISGEPLGILDPEQWRTVYRRREY